jgi:polyisoprenoid-binding protein YceI
VPYVLFLGLALTLVPTAPISLRTSADPSLALRGQANPERVGSADTLGTRWVVSAGSSEARYLVREQLAGFDFPNDAVGKTDAVTGAIVVTGDGTVVSEQSEFRVRLATLATDNERRDGYVKTRTLEVEQYPEAVLVPNRFLGLPGPFPESGTLTFQLEGDLTLHGVTRPTVWEVTAEFGAGAISGLATTAFQFDIFGVAVPRVARVLSVDDNIRLELEFRLVPEAG